MSFMLGVASLSCNSIYCVCEVVTLVFLIVVIVIQVCFTTT
jgi:hypothetical protein